MKAVRNATAAAELLLLSPALLFMIAVVVRHLQPLDHEPAHTAQQIVMWYSGRIWTLWVLLIALPLAVVVTGCGVLLRSWNEDAASGAASRNPFTAIRTRPATLLLAATTLTSGVILAIIALHMLAN